MKALVVFYSRTGRAMKVGDHIASGLSADIEALVDKKNRKGFVAYIRAALDAARKKETSIAEPKNDPTGYDLIVLGTPIWSGKVTPAVRTYINRYRHAMKSVAFYCLYGTSGQEKVFAEMQQLTGKKPKKTLALSAEDMASGAYKKKTEGFASSLKKD